MTEVSEHLGGNRMKKKKERPLAPDLRARLEVLYISLLGIRTAPALLLFLPFFSLSRSFSFSLNHALSPSNFLSVAFLNCEVALYARKPAGGSSFLS